jgi:SAM-dependent methyltransferase
MRRPECIARQSRHPTGLMGRLIGHIMAAETARANEHALRLLRPAPTDRVLEVGFGHGRTIHLAADMVPRGFVAGVDPSAEMVRMASRRNRRHIAAGRVALVLSDAVSIPFPDGAFDKVYGIHVLYFWPQPRDQLREIRRVLKPGGRMVLGFRVRSDERSADFPPSVYRFHDLEEIQSLLADCGFRAIGAEISPDRTVLVSAER